jgi:hypothetical protein
MTFTKKITIVCFVILAYSCTNKEADFNNNLFDIHTAFQNTVKSADEKINSDSITLDSAKLYIADAEKICLTQFALLKNLKPTKAGVPFYNAVKELFEKQLNAFTLQQKIYANGDDAGLEFSNLQDSLDNNKFVIDSLDADVIAKQLEFAKANKFKLQ